MPIRDGLNHSLCILFVGAAWLLGKINEMTAIPVLLALAGLITLPVTIAARAAAISSGTSSDKNKAVRTPPDALLALIAAGGTLSMLTKYLQIAALVAVAVGTQACGADYSGILQRTGHGLLAMREAYMAACNEGLDPSDVCRRWGSTLNDVVGVYDQTNDLLDGGAE